MTDIDEDEWEYEYDSTETEDFYIPLDLSNVPSAQIPTNSERRPGHPTLLKSRLRALNATRGQAPEPTSIDATSTQETATMGEIQISGLHTENPLIMYNDQLLSCHWTSTIGTDMFFTKPGDGTDSHQPIRSLPSVDLMALGTAKLVARVGRLRPRDEVIAGEDATQPESIGVGQESEAILPTTENQQTAQRLPKTNFLAKLNEAKARRGETSRLAVTQTPSGPRLVSEPVTRADQGPAQPTSDVAMSGT